MSDVVPQGGMSHLQFDYDAAPSIFFARTGWGPLLITMDTNLLIDLALNHEEIGGSFGFDGGGFAPALWVDPIRALHDVFLLWFWRDVRFYLPPEQMNDGRLSAERERSRRSILDAFSQDFWERGGFDRSSQVAGEPIDTGDDLVVPHSWPASFYASLPRDMDGVLVNAAASAGVHVFLTHDAGVLRTANRLADFSLAILTPEGLLTTLAGAGELDRVTLGSLPAPDLQSLAHFYAVFPQAT